MKDNKNKELCEAKFKLNLDRSENNFSQETTQLLTEYKK